MDRKVKQRYVFEHRDERSPRGELCDDCREVSASISDIVEWHETDGGRIVLVVTE